MNQSGMESDEQMLRDMFSGPDPVKPRKESSVERAFVRWCRKHNIRQRKIEDGEGYPDRQVFLGQGRIACIEFKRPGGRGARRNQLAVHQELSIDGVPTLVTSDVEAATEWIEKLKSGSPMSTSEPQRSSSTGTP